MGHGKARLAPAGRGKARIGTVGLRHDGAAGAQSGGPFIKPARSQLDDRSSIISRTARMSSISD
jgi:hypothetical protein